jgi:hypothetical protein
MPVLAVHDQAHQVADQDAQQAEHQDHDADQQQVQQETVGGELRRPLHEALQAE